MNLNILIPLIFLAYMIITLSWMQFTLRYPCTINHYVFRKELTSGQRKSFMHYVEMIALSFLLIGFITTLISQLQILIKKIRKENNDKN